MFNKKLIAIYIFFVLFSSYLIWTFFKGIPENNFLYLGDQFFRVTLHEALVNSFFIRKAQNLSVFNAWQQMTQVWDFIYYILIYSLGISFITAEKILFFIVLLFSQVFAFHGFVKIQQLVLNKKFSILSILAITLWYCFNPYTLQLWHGGVYNIGLGLTYSLAPLLFAYFHSSIFSKTNSKHIIFTALLLFISSFIFWLFAVIVVFLGLYTILYFIYTKPPLKQVGKNILLLASIYILLSLPVIYAIVHELHNNVGDNNGAFTPVYGNQQGGIWYQLLFLFSWGVYTIWHPRTMYSFDTFFFSWQYITSVILLYTFIVGGISLSFYTNHLKKKSHLISIFIIIFCVAVFFAKGAQPPFGEVFEFMYNYVPFFSVFRTPDIRFGFLIIFCLSVLLLLIQQIYKRWFFIFILLIITTIQCFYLFNGIAIKGENIKDKFYDRVLFIPQDYQEIISYLNTSSSIDSYILPIPSDEYGIYHYKETVFNLGPDILSKFINHPFIYLSTMNGTSTDTYSILKSIVDNQDYAKLNQFPIKYILVRNDLQCETCKIDVQKLSHSFNRVYKNSTFVLYEAKKYKPLIDSNNAIYHTINPVTNEVEINKLQKSQSLQLALSYNPNWKLFLQKNSEESRKESTANINLTDIFYIFQKPVFENTHTKFNGYGNEWQIDPQTIRNNYAEDYYKENSDKSINIQLKVIYLPQVYYLLSLIISVLTALGCICYLIFKKT